MVLEEEKKEAATHSEISESDGEFIFGPGMDGMGTFTAKLAIDRKLRRELMENYDLIEVVNKGRYYTAKAHSKDGSRLYDLLIDKQGGTLKITGQKQIK